MMQSGFCWRSGEGPGGRCSGCSPPQDRLFAMRRMIPIGFVLDTWILAEYWKGDATGRPWVEERSPLFSSTITFAEMVRYFTSQGIDPTTILLCLDDIRARSNVVPVDDAIAISAGHLKNREMEGIVGVIILTTARAGGHQVVTGDPALLGDGGGGVSWGGGGGLFSD
jgi:predicted nucleic acid-binding protein